MSDLKEIKSRIYEEEKIEVILEALQCENIDSEQNGNMITAQLPSHFGSKNIRAVQIRNKETLPSYIRNKGISGDIFSIIGFILFDCYSFEQIRENIFDIKDWIYEVLEWEYFDGTDEITETKQDHNSWLTKLKKQRKQRSSSDSFKHKRNTVINESNLKRYINIPHFQFRVDGILWKTQKEFGVGFDIYSNRIIYPVYNKWGQLIGVKGRLIGEHKHEAGVQKYLYLLPCDKSIELFNLHRAKPYIQTEKEVLVFESAKSVMLAHQYGYKNAVSIEGSEVSQYQAFLLKELNATIVFCFDEDMTIEHIKKQADTIKNRLCYAIIDNSEEKLLDAKMSPVDKGKTIWKKLYHKNKFKVT